MSGVLHEDRHIHIWSAHTETHPTQIFKRCSRCIKGRDGYHHQSAKCHTTHTHLHTKLPFSTRYNTYNTLPPHTHVLTFHLEDISRDVWLICGLIPGRAWFRALLMEGLIVCQLPGCQVRHVGSQPGFSSLPFMCARFFFFPQSLQNWICMLPLKKSPACQRGPSMICPRCASCWHLRTEDRCAEGTVHITLLSTLQDMVCICKAVSSGTAPCNH